MNRPTVTPESTAPLHQHDLDRMLAGPPELRDRASHDRWAEHRRLVMRRSRACVSDAELVRELTSRD